jgi:hypothetical protein
MIRLCILALSLVTITLGCADSTTSPCACTEEFRYFTVTILDDALQPVQNATLTRTNLRTGRVIEPGWLGLPTPGTYLVADDGLRDEFSSAGDILRVVCSQGGADFTADFVFATPAPCRCHLELRAGPDTVVIGDPPPLAVGR